LRHLGVRMNRAAARQPVRLERPLAATSACGTRGKLNRLALRTPLTLEAVVRRTQAVVAGKVHASGLQDVRHGDGPVAADRLGERVPRALHLIRPRLAPELKDGLDHLVRAARPDRVPAGLEAAAGRDRGLAAGREAVFGGEAERLAARREPAGLERERRD